MLGFLPVGNLKKMETQIVFTVTNIRHSLTYFGISVHNMSSYVHGMPGVHF